MAVSCDAAHLRLIETLLELHLTRRSCVIRIERHATKKQLVLCRGALAFAESNLPEEHLAHVLIKMGQLPRKDLSRVTALMKSGKSSDEAVVLVGGLNGRQLEEGVREQAMSVMASLFAWQTCELRLFDGEGLIRRRCSLALSMPHVLVEAARLAVKRHCVPPCFQPLTGLVRADPAAGPRLSLPLSSGEAYALAQVKEPMPVSQLLPMLPEVELKPEGLVQCLLLLGLLRLEVPEHAAAPGALLAERIAGEIDELLQRFEVANLYEVLSVPPDAAEDDIKTAYHDLAKVYHPDLFESEGCNSGLRGRAEKLFTYITSAYTTLGDPGARAHYDEMRMKQESRVEVTLQARAAVDADRQKMAETLFRAARAALKNLEFEKAVGQFRECIWLCPDVARYYHFLGVAQAEIATLYKEAERHLLKAIELELAAALLDDA